MFWGGRKVTATPKIWRTNSSLTHLYSVQPALRHFTSTQRRMTCLTISSSISSHLLLSFFPWKSRQFPAPPLLLTRFRELLLTSPPLCKKKTVGSTTSDLPQPAGCHPKFYVETCESILLAPEVQHAPASFKKLGLLNHTFQDPMNLIW